MAHVIQIDQGMVEEKAGKIEGAGKYFKNSALSPQDTRTTIPANRNAKAAYGRAGGRMEKLRAALYREVENIRSLNVAFVEFDEMMGELSGGVERAEK